MTYASRIGALHILGLATALIASCGGESSDEAVGVDAPAATESVAGPSTSMSETPTTSAQAVPTSVPVPEATTCRDQAVPDPITSAGLAPAPVVALDDDPPWTSAFREPRIVDGTYLISDIEQKSGLTAPLVLPRGEHTTSALGGNSTLVLDEPWRLMRADPGLLVFTGADDPLFQGRPVLLVGRADGLPTIEAAVSDADGPVDQTTLTTIPDDLVTWFDELDAVVVDGCSNIELFGEDAVVYDVRIDPDAGDTSFCMPPGRCVTSFNWHTSGPANATTVNLNDRNDYRIWHIPSATDPFVAVAIALPDDFEEWTARAARLLVGLDPDLDEPLPLPDDVFGQSRGVAPVGPLVPLSLPDLRVDIDQPVWAALFSQRFIVGPLDDAPPWQEGSMATAFVIETGTNGDVETVDDALAALDQVATVGAAGDDQMLGRPATKVTVTADEPTRVFRTTTGPAGTASEETGFGWWWTEQGDQNLWLIPVDDRLFAVAADPSADIDLQATTEFTQEIFGDAQIDVGT